MITFGDLFILKGAKGWGRERWVRWCWWRFRQAVIRKKWKHEYSPKIFISLNIFLGKFQDCSKNPLSRTNWRSCLHSTLSTKSLINFQHWEETLPEAQRTQGIESITWVISPAKKNENSVDKKSQVKDFIGSNFGQQVALLALVTSLTTRWRDLYWLVFHLNMHSDLFQIG